MTSTATAQKPIATGESKAFPAAGGHTISVVKTGDDAYRIVVTNQRGLAVTHYTTMFDTALGNVPLGQSARRAAWTYIQQVNAELTADAERPADVAARTAANYATADLARLSTAQINALRTADRDGVIHRGHGVIVATLRSLYRQHLGTLVYDSRGMRKYVVGVRLGGHGQRLATHVQTTSNIAA